MKMNEFIRNARLKANLSQGDVAKRLGLTNGQFISNIERGVAPCPPCHWRALSRIFDAPIDLFIEAAVVDYRHRLRHRFKVR